MSNGISISGTVSHGGMQAFRESKSVDPDGVERAKQFFSLVYPRVSGEPHTRLRGTASPLNGGTRAFFTPSIYAPTGQRVYSLPTHFDIQSSSDIVLDAYVAFEEENWGIEHSISAGAWGGEILEPVEYQLTGQSGGFQPFGVGVRNFIAGEGVVQLRAKYRPAYNESDIESPFSYLPGDRSGVPFSKVSFPNIEIQAYNGTRRSDMLDVFPCTPYGRPVSFGYRSLGFRQKYTNNTTMWGEQKVLVNIQNGVTAKISSPSIFPGGGLPAWAASTNVTFQTITVQAINASGEFVSDDGGRELNDDGMIEVPRGEDVFFTNLGDDGARFLDISASPKLPFKPIVSGAGLGAPLEITAWRQVTAEV